MLSSIAYGSHFRRSGVFERFVIIYKVLGDFNSNLCSFVTLLQLVDLYEPLVNLVMAANHLSHGVRGLLSAIFPVTQFVVRRGVFEV